MNQNFDEFKRLHNLFKQHGFNLYLVGGTVRDFLLGLEVKDMDVVTDAIPSEIKKFLPGADYTFEKFGSVRFKSNGIKFDVTTLRQEKRYLDSRHPTEITFTKELKIDVIRRDFTVNGMYMDNHYQLIDFVHGERDLNKRILKMIGNPSKRIKEDPLRIIRAVRFALQLNFDIDKKLEKAMLENKHLLKNLKKEKIIQDLNKLISFDENRKNELFNKFSITEILNVVD